MVGVGSPHRVVQHVVVVPLRASARSAGLVEQVVARHVRVPREVFRHQPPQLRRLCAVRLSERAVLVKVCQLRVAAVVVAVLRPDRTVQVEYGVQPVLFAHFKRPVQPAESVLAQREVVGMQQFDVVRPVAVVLCGKIAVKVHISERNAHDVEPQRLDVCKVLFRNPAVLVRRDEFLRPFLAEARIERHIRFQRIRLFGGTHPALLHQPSAEVGAAERHGFPCGIHDVFAVCGKQRKRLRPVLLVTGDEHERRRGKREYCCTQKRNHSSHNFILQPRRVRVNAQSSPPRPGRIRLAESGKFIENARGMCYTDLQYGTFVRKSVRNDVRYV